ncbi:hypothetical protein BH11BAC7_BH11BAC7_05470 [soil metagenome]
MKINSGNCEAWFLDYYEGNLSKEGVEELFAFLVLNPDLRDVFDSYEEISFSPDKQISFEGKRELKKAVAANVGINETNYEEYFVSYVEGLLNANEKAEVEKFLLQFPAKREELELLQQAILFPDETIVFEHKDSLRKSVLVGAENFEEMAIASVEGLLNSEEEKAVMISLAANPEQQKAYALYQQTKSTADASVIFEEKESLKRKDRGAFWWMMDTRFAAAAAIALLVGIFFWNYKGNDGIVKDFAGIDTAKTKRVTNPINSVKDPVANNGIAPEVKVENNIQEKQQPRFVKNTPSPAPANDVVKGERRPATFINADNNHTLAANVTPQVIFSDAYYSYTEFGSSTPAATQRSSITLGQAAMRWMKNKLDRTPAEANEDNTYMAAVATGKNGDVSGFDLTSSAVSALGNATGAKLRLGHEAKGTILTVGKYEVLLSRGN